MSRAEFTTEAESSLKCSTIDEGYYWITDYDHNITHYRKKEDNYRSFLKNEHEVFFFEGCF